MGFKKVLLVSVSYKNSAYKPGDVPELGLGYLAEYLVKNGFEYDVMDMNLGYTFDDLVKKINECKPDLIGVATKTYRYKDAFAFINSIKEKFPNIKIAVGGSHVSIVKEKVLEDCKGMDFGVVKEGEETFLELCQGKKLSEIKGLIYREGNKIIFTGERPFEKDLSKLPWPKYEKFEMKKYWYPGICILTSRGCPESCTFCPVPVINGKWWRSRTPESVMEEVKYWYEKGWRRFEIIDDNFTLHKDRAREICKLIKESGIKAVFNCPQGIRADRSDFELLKQMKEVGWTTMTFGVEVGNDKMLKIIKKGEDMKTIETAIKNSVDLGFEVHLNMMYGFTGQTMEDVEDGFKLALKYPIRHAGFNNLVPYPGTEDFKRSEEGGYFQYSPEEYLNSVKTKAYKVVIATPEIPADKCKN